jgi:serine/threonine-protein kinase
VIAGESVTPTRVDEYAIRRLVGEGGMGRVFEATAPDGTRVALKLLKSDLSRDQTFRRRFQREVLIARTVRHPNVVSVLAAGQHGDVPYLVQPFIDGQSLEQRIDARGPLDSATALRIVGDVAAGLEAVWQAGMVHRDIKPGNILLDEHGVAYITDFGLAKSAQGSLLTRPGQALGSVDYMAPEQIRGEELGAAADLYALGCVMYECVCGRPPFAEAKGMRVLWAHLQSKPPDPSLLCRDVSPTLGAALVSALEKEPHARPSSAAAYVRMLAAAAGG